MTNKKPTLFAKLALDYADHPKIMMLSDAAFRAHITFILYCRRYMTDGIIRNPVANRLALQWDTDVLHELQNNDEDTPSLQQLENGDYYLSGYAEMQETRDDIEARRQRNSRNGAKGGRPRKKTGSTKTTKTETQSETQSVTEPLTQSLTESGAQKKADKERDKELTMEPLSNGSSQPASDRFEEFWKAYPKRTGQNPKKPARDKYNKIVKTVDPQTLIDAAASYARQQQGSDPKFIAQAITWLNQERWQDTYDIEETKEKSTWNMYKSWNTQN